MGNTPSAGQVVTGILKIPRALIVDLVVTASLTLPAVMQVPADCDFEWWWLSINRTDARLKALMVETGSAQRNLIYSGSPQSAAAFNGILVDNWAGLVASNGALPIAVPYVMPANRAYQFIFTDSSGSNNTVQLALHGFGLLKT